MWDKIKTELVIFGLWVRGCPAKDVALFLFLRDVEKGKFNHILTISRS